MTREPPLVLLVDDEPFLLRMLEVNLRATGFEVRTAPSGADAERSEQDPPEARGYPADVHVFLSKPVEPAVLVETARRAVVREDS